MRYYSLPTQTTRVDSQRQKKVVYFKATLNRCCLSVQTYKKSPSLQKLLTYHKVNEGITVWGGVGNQINQKKTEPLKKLELQHLVTTYML